MNGIQSAKTDRVTDLQARRRGIVDTRLISPSELVDEDLVSEITAVSSECVEQVFGLVRGVGGLIGLSTREMMGLGFSKRGSARIAAALELSVRLARLEIPSGDLLDDPDAVARYLFLKYRKPVQEVMGAIFLNARNRVLSDRVFFQGTLTRAAVEPRPMLREGLERGAAGMILFHTHPSGDPRPSAEDLSFTRRTADAGDIVGVRLVDHLVLGSPTQWVSLKEQGGW